MLNETRVKTMENGNLLLFEGREVHPVFGLWTTYGHTVEQVRGARYQAPLTVPATHNVVYSRSGYFTLNGTKYAISQHAALGHHIRNPQAILDGWDVLTPRDDKISTWVYEVEMKVQFNGGDFVNWFIGMCLGNPFALHYTLIEFANDCYRTAEAGFRDIYHEYLGFVQIRYETPRDDNTQLEFNISSDIYGTSTFRVPSNDINWTKF